MINSIGAVHFTGKQERMIFEKKVMTDMRTMSEEAFDKKYSNALNAPLKKPTKLEKILEFLSRPMVITMQPSKDELKTILAKNPRRAFEPLASIIEFTTSPIKFIADKLTRLRK